MDFPVLIAALAVNLLTAWAALAHSDPTFLTRRPRPVRPSRPARAPRREPAATEPVAHDADDGWIAEPEPLVVSGGAEAVAGGSGPVLAYIRTPRRSPEPSRFIQTEVLVPDGRRTRAMALGRLAAILTLFGALLAFAVIASIRLMVWAFENLFGA